MYNSDSCRKLFFTYKLSQASRLTFLCDFYATPKIWSYRRIYQRVSCPLWHLSREAIAKVKTSKAAGFDGIKDKTLDIAKNFVAMKFLPLSNKTFLNEESSLKNGMKRGMGLYLKKTQTSEENEHHTGLSSYFPLSRTLWTMPTRLDDLGST